MVASAPSSAPWPAALNFGVPIGPGRRPSNHNPFGLFRKSTIQSVAFKGYRQRLNDDDDRIQREVGEYDAARSQASPSMRRSRRPPLHSIASLRNRPQFEEEHNSIFWPTQLPARCPFLLVAWDCSPRDTSLRPAARTLCSSLQGRSANSDREQASGPVATPP
jgi:hypothetical protein